MQKNFNCRQKVLIENKIDSIDYTKHIYLKLICFYIIIEIFRFSSCTDRPKQWAVDCPSPISVRRCIFVRDLCDILHTQHVRIAIFIVKTSEIRRRVNIATMKHGVIYFYASLRVPKRN